MPAPDPNEFPPPGSVWWPKDAEANWAKQANFPTKLAGWLVLGGFLLALLAALIPGSSGGRVDILTLIAGCYILHGNQGWLRFMAVISLGVPVIALLMLGLELAFPTSSNASSGGFTFTIRTPHHWVGTVGDFGVAVFQGMACLLALRTRQLVLWTRCCRIWTGIFVAAALLLVVSSGRESYKSWRTEQLIRLEFQKEIDAAKRHLDLRGTSRHYDPEPVMRANARITMVYWDDTPPGLSGWSSANVLYERGTMTSWSGVGDLHVPHTTPSGDSGEIIFHLDPPL